MPRRSNQKLKLMYLSKILTEQTDVQNALTLSQISEQLNKYGIQCGRKCLYDDMEALRVFGIDIKTKRDRYVRYYVDNSDLDYASLKLYSDFLLSSPYISEKKTVDLIKKITEQNKDAKKLLDLSNCEFSRYVKSYNDDAYKNINLICRAMGSDCQLSFKCFDWNSNKQRILRKNGETVCISPWRLDLREKGYMLFAFDAKQGKIVTFSPDRLVSVQILKNKREGRECFEQYISSTHSYVNIRLKCDNSFVNDLFWRFGINVTVLAVRESFFEVSVKTVEDDSLMAWLFVNSDKIELISPDYLVEQYRELLKTSNGLYIK